MLNEIKMNAYSQSHMLGWLHNIAVNLDWLDNKIQFSCDALADDAMLAVDSLRSQLELVEGEILEATIVE